MTFVRISSNQPLKTTKDLTFKFDLNVYATGLNPYLATHDPFYSEQWYLFNGAGKNVDSELLFLILTSLRLKHGRSIGFLLNTNCN